MRAGSVGAMAENAEAQQQMSSQLVQFAEALRIIVLDAVRTNLSQARQMPAASSSSIPPAIKGGSSSLQGNKPAACSTSCSPAPAP